MQKWDRMNEKGLAKSERPESLQIGEKFTKTYLPAPRALFWDQDIKARKDGTRYGDGLFKPEVYALHLVGINLQALTPAQVEAVSLLIRLIFPFAAVILVGLLTVPMAAGNLDRFYARQRTPVNENPDRDRMDVEASIANPDGTAEKKLFPGSNWEFIRLPRYDLIGMGIAASVGVVLTIAVLLLSVVGK
jgi:hypothetical protein